MNPLKCLFVLLSAITLLTANKISCQNIQLYDTASNMINSSHISVNGIVGNTHISYISVKNNSSAQIAIKVKKVVLSDIVGATNYFTWGGNCYTPAAYVSAYPVNIDPQNIDNSFSSEFSTSTEYGFASIMYVFFDSTNPSDSSYVIIDYNIQPFQIIDQPVSQYGCLNATTVLNITVDGIAEYQWQVNTGSNWINLTNNSDINGSSTSMLVINCNSLLYDNKNFRCILNNSTFFDTSSVVSFNVIALITEISNDTIVCPGQSVPINVQCTSNYPAISGSLIYSWSPAQGLSAIDTNNPIATAPNTTNYIVNISDQNGCSVNDSILISVENPLPPSVDGGSDIYICPGANVVLSGSGAETYSWNNGVNDGIPFSPSVTTTYTVIGTAANGCYNSDQVTVYVQHVFQNEQLCLVTVDTNTWKNMIMWEKTPNMGTGSYNIYKEVSTNIYNWIGSVPYDSSSVFIDVYSAPESHGDKYKISVIDTCNNESIKSKYHKTMNLVISTFGSTMGLSWTPYETEDGSFVPANYYIYKGTQPNNLQLLDSVSGSFTSYNDNNVYDTYYYMVGVKKSVPCNITGTYSFESFSNKKMNFNSSVNNITIQNIIIYPNPFKETTTINFNNPDNNPFTLSLTDASGRIVRSTYDVTGSEILIDRKDLNSGIYFLELKGEGKLYRGKLVVE